MPNIRRCYNENCEYNLYGSYCDCVDITIGSDGGCEDFREKKSEGKEDVRTETTDDSK